MRGPRGPSSPCTRRTRSPAPAARSVVGRARREPVRDAVDQRRRQPVGRGPPDPVDVDRAAAAGPGPERGAGSSCAARASDGKLTPMLARMLMVLAVAWPLPAAEAMAGRVRRPADLRPRRRADRPGADADRAPDGTGSVELEHGIDARERVALRLTARSATGSRGSSRGRPRRDRGGRARADPGRLRLFGASRRRGGQLAVRRAAAGARGAVARARGAGGEVRASARVALVELAQHRLQLAHAPRELIRRCRRPSAPRARDSGS